MKNKKLFAILTLVCFMMTLMPVAAFAADADDSYVFTDDKNAEASVDEDVTVQFDLHKDVTTDTVYVWFMKDGSKEATTNVKFNDGSATLVKPNAYGVFKLTGVKSGDDYDFQFTSDDKYTVQAAFADPSAKFADETYKTLAEAFSNATQKLGTLTDQKTIEITTSNSSRDYSMIYVSGPNVTKIVGTEFKAEKEDTYNNPNATTLAKSFYDNVYFYVDGVKANNVTDKTITLKIVDKNGDAVKGETVTFETGSANIELNKEKATTDRLGKVDFKIAGVRDGEYKIYVKCGSYEATIVVSVGATGAYDIQVAKAPTAPFDVTSDLGEKIQFSFTDANGNAVTADEAENNGAIAAFNSTKDSLSVPTIDTKNKTNCRPYVAVVSKPSASKLENKDLYLVDASKADKDGNEYRANLALASTAKDLAEGSYEVKVVLDNGKYVTVTFEVKEFQTPVALNLTYEADAVELDSQVAIDTLEWVDANGVTKDAKGKVDLAATGYAVEDFDTETGLVTVKDDEKYVGSKITVIAVDDRYNLTAKAELSVADEASELAFDTKTLAIDANNKVKVSVVDSQGNRVALNRTANGIKDATISYVVLDKPEGSKVSVTTDGADNKLTTEGTFVMNVTANKVGNVTIQAVAKVTKTNNNNNQKDVVKYYTGTQIFAVGKDSVGQVVVMSIGSNEIIINDAKGTIDAAPMIQNDRTYVPFRALAEAFGAEVAYDEATQAVTAELNGVTVVMTIGSATYTVNGAEKTMDVAPFITGSRTMIPVRFAAEAFGIKVIPTYNPDGSTADILFNL